MNTIRTICLRFLLPLVLAAALLLCGLFCSRLLLDSQLGPSAAGLLRATEDQLQSANSLLLQPHTYKSLWRYTFAYLDATLTVEFIPHYDLPSLWTFLQNLPPDVRLEQVRFSPDAVCFTVSADSTASLVAVEKYLTDCGYYRQAEPTLLPAEEGIWAEYLCRLA